MSANRTDRAIKSLRESTKKNTVDIRIIKDSIKTINPRPPVKIGKSEITIRKALINPRLDYKTVLTDSTWQYVELYLKKLKNQEALTYWYQAENFYKATEFIDILSKPLTTYYCFLNATKALLTIKNVGFDTKHGVSGKRLTGQINLQNEKIYLQPRGVLSGLCNYLKEPVAGREEYTLKDILYNLEYIHRAYNMTFPSQPELYIPIEDPRFVFDKSKKEGWFEAKLEPQYSNTTTIKNLVGFGLDNYYDNSSYYTIRRNKKFGWEATRNSPTITSMHNLTEYYFKVRSRLRYIYSANKLWYIKRADLNGIVNRNTLSITFAAMHRLSEMSRYDPNTLEMHLSKAQGWLLSEFITKSIYQFIDMVSSEITGDDFRVTGFRT